MRSVPGTMWQVRCDVCGRTVPVEQTRASMWGVAICKACDEGPDDHGERGGPDDARSWE